MSQQANKQQCSPSLDKLYINTIDSLDEIVSTLKEMQLQDTISNRLTLLGIQTEATNLLKTVQQQLTRVPSGIVNEKYTIVQQQEEVS